MPLAGLLRSLAVLSLLAGGLSGQVVGTQEGARKENLDLPQESASEQQEETAPIETIQFYGGSYEGEAFFFVMDRSATMRDCGELSLAKREAARAVRELPHGTEFALVFFAREVVSHPESERPLVANPLTRKSAVAWLESVSGSAGTCCAAGLRRALRFAANSTARHRTIIFLGDGLCGCIGRKATLSRTRAAAQQVGARIHTVGIGQPDREFLATLAHQNDGTYREMAFGR